MTLLLVSTDVQAARTVQVVVGDDEEVDEFGRRRKRKTAVSAKLHFCNDCCQDIGREKGGVVEV